MDKNKSFKEKMLKSQDNFESKSFHVLHDTVSKQWEWFYYCQCILIFEYI